MVYNFDTENLMKIQWQFFSPQVLNDKIVTIFYVNPNW